MGDDIKTRLYDLAKDHPEIGDTLKSIANSIETSELFNKRTRVRLDIYKLAFSKAVYLIEEIDPFGPRAEELTSIIFDSIKDEIKGLR